MYRAYDSFNVTTWPMKIVTTYPMVVFLLEIPVNKNPGTQDSTNPINKYCRYTKFSNYVYIQL